MKSIKKLTAVALSVLLAFSCFAVTAFADGATVTNSVAVSGSVIGGKGNLSVDYVVTDGLKDVVGIQVEIKMPEGATAGTPVINPELSAKWTLKNDGNTYILLNKITEPLEAQVALEKLATLKGGKYNLFTLPVTVGAPKTYTAKMKVIDITTAPENSNDVSQEKDYSFTASGTCPHSSTTIVGKKAATCTAKGYTGDKVCTVCKATITKGKDIAVIAHKYGSYKVTKKATYFAKGTKTATCTICKKATKTASISKLTLKTPKVKVTAAKKSLKIKVTKVTGQTGFQIRYKVKGAKKWTVKKFTGKKTVTKTIKSLKAKKNYQVQVCAVVKSSGKKPATSKWSKTVTKKTK